MYGHRQTQKKTQPYNFNISRPHVETNSKFSLFIGTRGARQLCFRMLETSNWLVVIYSGHQIAEPRDPQYKNALPQEGLAYGCSAIRPSP